MQKPHPEASKCWAVWNLPMNCSCTRSWLVPCLSLFLISPFTSAFWSKNKEKLWCWVCMFLSAERLSPTLSQWQICTLGGIRKLTFCNVRRETLRKSFIHWFASSDQKKDFFFFCLLAAKAIKQQKHSKALLCYMPVVCCVALSVNFFYASLRLPDENSLKY